MRSGRPWRAPPRTLWRTRGVRPRELSAIGITNQRETTLVWERRSGRPVHRAIVWQDRRTAGRCAQLPADLIRERTGLVPDPYFSATKLEWILGRTDLPQQRARVRDGRHVARLEADRRRGSHHRRDECVADDAARSGDRRVGRRAARPLRRRAVGAAVGRRLVGRSSPRPRCWGRACRLPGSPATSRPRSSARPASRPERRRRPTGREPSCSSTSASVLLPSRTVCWRRLPRSRRGRRLSSPPREPCSSAAPRCSGCATGSA